MSRWEIAYLGSSYKLVETLVRDQRFGLTKIICERERVNRDLILCSEIYGVPLEVLDPETDLIQVFKDSPGSVTLYMMYGFGRIIPQSLLDTAIIFNIHPGSLIKNRGRNPIEHSILDNQPMIEVHLHQITAQIDSGLLIAKQSLPFHLKDDGVTIRNEIESRFPSLLDDLCRYLSGEIQCESIAGGRYRQRIGLSDYTLDLERDTLSQIYNKIRSQRPYRGAILNMHEKQIWITDIADIELTDPLPLKIEWDRSGAQVIVQRDGFRVWLSAGGEINK